MREQNLHSLLPSSSVIKSVTDSKTQAIKDAGQYTNALQTFRGFQRLCVVRESRDSVFEIRDPSWRERWSNQRHCAGLFERNFQSCIGMELQRSMQIRSGKWIRPRAYILPHFESFTPSEELTQCAGVAKRFLRSHRQSVDSFGLLNTSLLVSLSALPTFVSE